MYLFQLTAATLSGPEADEFMTLTLKRMQEPPWNLAESELAEVRRKHQLVSLIM